MLNINRIFLLLFMMLCLASCASHRASPNADLLHETWMSQVETTSSRWTQGVDHWFMRPGGPPPVTAFYSEALPLSAVMSSMEVAVPRTLHYVKAAGAFQVQFFITRGRDSVTLYGPNALLRQVTIHVTPQGIVLSQAPETSPNMNCVLVRIGVHALHDLVQKGSGLIIGQLALRDPLHITSFGRGDIYLAGTLPVTAISSMGGGSVTVLGAVTPEVTIRARGRGDINLQGNVGVCTLTHTGSGDVNIVGANTDHLTIHAGGRGKIGLYGFLTVNEINARDWVRIYAYQVQGNHLEAHVTNFARVGLKGSVKTLTVSVDQAARFEGTYLKTKDAYVRARDRGHANVQATNQLFASAIQNGSIYYFGHASALTKIQQQNGTVLML